MAAASLGLRFKGAHHLKPQISGCSEVWASVVLRTVWEGGMRKFCLESFPSLEASMLRWADWAPGRCLAG